MKKMVLLLSSLDWPSLPDDIFPGQWNEDGDDNVHKPRPWSHRPKKLEAVVLLASSSFGFWVGVRENMFFGVGLRENMFLGVG